MARGIDRRALGCLLLFVSVRDDEYEPVAAVLAHESVNAPQAIEKRCLVARFQLRFGKRDLCVCPVELDHDDLVLSSFSSLVQKLNLHSSKDQ